jgi:hypothetical protein
MLELMCKGNHKKDHDSSKEGTCSNLIQHVPKDLVRLLMVVYLLNCLHCF